MIVRHRRSEQIQVNRSVFLLLLKDLIPDEIDSSLDTQVSKPPTMSEIPVTPLSSWWHFWHGTVFEGSMLLRKRILVLRCWVVCVLGHLGGLGKDWGSMREPYSDPIAIIPFVARDSVLIGHRLTFPVSYSLIRIPGNIARCLCVASWSIG